MMKLRLNPFVAEDLKNIKEYIAEDNENSIGIIGGADGPTAIFVTTTMAPFAYQIIVPLILLILGVVGFYLLEHKKRK